MQSADGGTHWATQDKYLLFATGSHYMVWAGMELRWPIFASLLLGLKKVKRMDEGERVGSPSPQLDSGNKTAGPALLWVCKGLWVTF